MGCGSGANSAKNDSLKKKDSLEANADPEKPHEVKKGSGGDYAFKPDTAIQSIILGNPECWRKYMRENGGTSALLEKGRLAFAYYNSSAGKKQEMEVCVTKNEKGDYIPYAIIVQYKNEEHAPKLSVSATPSSDFNFVSGHGVYVGMSQDYVMSIYSNQSFMEWEKGDTVYLQYKPKPKDGNYYKRYKPDSYSVTYKFKDEILRRMEYSVDPAQFESKK
jgi:hypothetical protein